MELSGDLNKDFMSDVKRRFMEELMGHVSGGIGDELSSKYGKKPAPAAPAPKMEPLPVVPSAADIETQQKYDRGEQLNGNELMERYRAEAQQSRGENPGRMAQKRQEYMEETDGEPGVAIPKGLDGSSSMEAAKARAAARNAAPAPGNAPKLRGPVAGELRPSPAGEKELVDNLVREMEKDPDLLKELAAMLGLK